MADPAKIEVLRSLGKMVRGLSTLFWGLPATMIIYVETARMDWLDFFGAWGMIPAVVLSAILWRGLDQLRHFQKQERVWQQSLNQAEIFVLINLGLSPFLFWWHRMPNVLFYNICISLLGLSGLLLLVQLNHVLRRLVAMLPDENLRAETSLFTGFNIAMFFALFIGQSAYFALQQMSNLPSLLGYVLAIIGNNGLGLALFLILMPLALTMALLWKTKEVIFTSVFESEVPDRNQ